MPSITVLIIDDTRSARDTAVLASRMLEADLSTPIMTITATTGVEGVQQLREQPHIDLVVLDVHLPGPDVDGRMLGALVRELHPNARILPFTADRSPETAAILQALGMEPPLLKPISPRDVANRMRQVLEGPTKTEAPPLQSFLANQTLQMVQLLEQGAAQLPKVALLAREHLARAGLIHILADVCQLVPCMLVNQSGMPEAATSALQHGEIALLVCPPRELRSAEEFALTFRVPILVYSTFDEAKEVLERPWSVVVGPTSKEELTAALQRTLAGESYRNSYIQQLLSLTGRQQRVLLLLVQGHTTNDIAASEALSEVRVRHIISELYEQLRLQPTRAALVAWAKEAPLHLLTAPQV